MAKSIEELRQHMDKKTAALRKSANWNQLQLVRAVFEMTDYDETDMPSEWFLALVYGVNHVDTDTGKSGLDLENSFGKLRSRPGRIFGLFTKSNLLKAIGVTDSVNPLSLKLEEYPIVPSGVSAVARVNFRLAYGYTRIRRYGAGDLKESERSVAMVEAYIGNAATSHFPYPNGQPTIPSPSLEPREFANRDLPVLVDPKRARKDEFGFHIANMFFDHLMDRGFEGL